MQEMEQPMVTEEDLRWWLTLAANVEWTFARTYAESAPHSYVVLNRTAGMTRDDFVRAAHVIHTFGQPAKFYSMTSIYLTSPDGRLKWWTMDKDLNDTNLINQATTERLYGVQNAPSTVSGIRTSYDEIATRYDEQHPITDAEARALMELVAPVQERVPDVRPRCRLRDGSRVGPRPDHTGSVRRRRPEPADAQHARPQVPERGEDLPDDDRAGPRGRRLHAGPVRDRDRLRHRRSSWTLRRSRRWRRWRVGPLFSSVTASWS